MTEVSSRTSQETLPQSRRGSFSGESAPLEFANNLISRSLSGSKTLQNDENSAFPGSVPDTVNEAEVEVEKGDVLTKVEKELSEEELRRLFDDEEIERFLALFADSVSEVTIPSSLSDEDSRAMDCLFQEEKVGASAPGLSIPESCGDNWLSIDSSKVPAHSRIPPSISNVQFISEYIAMAYLLPVLPAARPRPERFTLGGLRISIQRLYFVAHPAYRKFFSRASNLSTWKNRKESALYCTLFWILWYRNLLMPAAFFRILYSLLRRRILPYPTADELRGRRREAALTEELGEQIRARLGTTSSSGLLEAWRLFRVFSKPNKQKAKAKQMKAGDKGKGKDKDKQRGREKRMQQEESGLEEEADEVIVESITGQPEMHCSSTLAIDETVFDKLDESQAEKDFKRDLVNSLDDLADFHERLKNIFLWRLPSTSRTFVALLTLLAVLTTFLPTKYIVKIALFILGFLYWHVIPVIAALPAADRVRLPPLFENSPTDAEYAMGLISKRISCGEDIRPLRKKKQSKKSKRAGGPNDSTTSLVGGEESVDSSGPVNADQKAMARETGSEPSDRAGEIDWRRWGERAHTLKKWTMQGQKKQKNIDDEGGHEEDYNGQTYTFLAHYKASPGTLTISRMALLFTPVTSRQPKIRIALVDLRGVKKIGLNAVPGLSVKWQRTAGSGSYNETETEAILDCRVTEDKFWWVGGRDEVFARLVGWGSRKWLKV